MNDEDFILKEDTIVTSVRIDKKSYEKAKRELADFNFSSLCNEALKRKLSIFMPSLDTIEFYLLQLEGQILELQGSIKERTAVTNIENDKDTRKIKELTKEIEQNKILIKANK